MLLQSGVLYLEPQKRNMRGSNDSRAGDEPDFGGAHCFFTKAKEAIYEATLKLLLRVDVLRLERSVKTHWVDAEKRRKTKSKRSRERLSFRQEMSVL